MSEPSDLSLIFYGKNAEECEDFIRLVRLYAFKNRKAKDNAWIAEQVYPCFGGKALRWYLKQSQDVRDDWELLQQSLVREWPSVEDESSIQPTPAAAPPPIGGASQNRAGLGGGNLSQPRIGRLSVKLLNDPGFLGYLSKTLGAEKDDAHFHGSFVVTTDVEHSLEIEMLPTDKPHIWRLGVKNLPGVKYLAAYFCGNFEHYWGMVIGTTNAPSGRSGESTTYNSPSPRFNGHIYHTDVWEVGTQGGLSCRWPDQAQDSAPIPILVCSEANLGLNPNHIRVPGDKEAALFFLPS